jgi:hypothetical protein
MLDAAPPGRCADLLAAVLMPPPATRLAVLDAVDVPQRLHLALSLVKARTHLGHRAVSTTPRVVHSQTAQFMRPAAC